MGFLNDASSGFQKYKNTADFTNESLLQTLEGISVSFGTPVLDTVGKNEAVVYHDIGRFDVYAKVDAKNIEIARVLSKKQDTGKNLLKELAAASVTNATAKDMAVANRAVDELSDIVKRLLAGETVVTSNVAQSAANSIKYYMKQKIISIKDKYNIYDRDENPVYAINGNITGLHFSVQTAAGEELMNISKKLVALTPEYTLRIGKKEIGHLKKKIKLTRPEIVGKIDGKELTIKGDMTGYSFNILLDGVAVGNVDTERLTWGDCYSIEILDPALKDTVVAIAVICDNTLKGK